MIEPQADPTRPTLSRRRFWQLGAAAIVTSGVGISLLPKFDAEAATTSTTSQDHFDQAATLAGDNPILQDLVTRSSSAPPGRSCSCRSCKPC